MANIDTIYIMTTIQTKGLKRNTIDKYYTNPSIVDRCIDLVKQNITIDDDDLIIEPSAGNGAFIHGIKGLTKHCLFYDIAPEHTDIIQQDYLLYDHTSVQTTYRNIHVIGNPPFGRQSSMAIKFIKRSCEFCKSISFILPKSFKKTSLQKTFRLDFHLVCEWDLPDNAFLVDGQEHDVPCVFQIWIKQDNPRTVEEKLKPIQFEFVNKAQHPDISFRRVGVNAGMIDTNVDEKSIQSHYFIKFTNNKPLHDTIEKISNIQFTFNNTVGPKSISKQELIKEFMKVL